ncbi:hypothetical protein AVEN_212677-1 [Araneus ventricosus]|uniref:Uncharacterized protein n=1 Tax=Araneus ventricosus TaxID=182803 RepID=A0A4Y2W7M3_ARAVE|nr:hypothetical protein AVEN_212677-1 [Araneus ventricosus]
MNYRISAGNNSGTVKHAKYNLLRAYASNPQNEVCAVIGDEASHHSHQHYCASRGKREPGYHIRELLILVLELPAPGGTVKNLENN